ncbi:MAG: hypothetical protein NTV58_03280 [Deltaproteobacteria bacterium]|nr:hypothetical protein [Deltaproteobacteria bacterium]
MRTMRQLYAMHHPLTQKIVFLSMTGFFLAILTVAFHRFYYYCRRDPFQVLRVSCQIEPCDGNCIDKCIAGCFLTEQKRQEIQGTN